MCISGHSFTIFHFIKKPEFSFLKGSVVHCNVLIAIGEIILLFSNFWNGHAPLVTWTQLIKIPYKLESKIWLFDFQLFTLGHFVLIGMNLAIFNTKVSLLVFEVQVSKVTICFCQILMIFGQFFILFIIIESFLIRYWTKFVWKSVQPIDDKFIINFLAIFNSFISLLFALYEYMPKMENNNYFVYYLTGQIAGEFKTQISNKFRYDYT